MTYCFEHWAIFWWVLCNDHVGGTVGKNLISCVVDGTMVAHVSFIFMTKGR